jgi:hypothetical protein
MMRLSSLSPPGNVILRAVVVEVIVFFQGHRDSLWHMYSIIDGGTVDCIDRVKLPCEK